MAEFEWNLSSPDIQRAFNAVRTTVNLPRFSAVVDHWSEASRSSAQRSHFFDAADLAIRDHVIDPPAGITAPVERSVIGRLAGVFYHPWNLYGLMDRSPDPAVRTELLPVFVPLILEGAERSLERLADAHEANRSHFFAIIAPLISYLHEPGCPLRSAALGASVPDLTERVSQLMPRIVMGQQVTVANDSVSAGPG
ncbi:MAG TPA: hypothetical protein VHB73_07095 [Alphaproteobacteria bacterium]|nr:hypothetical protein [Alphaproteobacteria bacterium]